MVRWTFIVVLAALVPAACGRTSGRDAGLASRQDGGETHRSEDGSPGPGDSAANGVNVPDTNRAPDRPPSPDTADAPTRFACNALAPLAARGPFRSLATRNVLFTNDRSLVVLQATSAEAGQGHDILVVRLPGGEVSTIATRIYDLEWLVPGTSLLLKTVDNDLVLASLDGAETRVLARGSYDHSLSPDRKRLFSFGECTHPPCALDAINIATGVSTRVSHRAALTGPSFSPSGRFWAFTEEGAGDGGISNSVLRIFDESGQDYAISSQPGVSYPVFVSDDLLIFLVRTAATVSPYPNPTDLRGHVPGSGDRSTLIATGYHFAPHNGYDLSPDGRWILGAKAEDADENSQLVAIPLDGSGPRILANDLFPSWTTSMPLDGAGFVGNEHVIYVTRAGSPASFNLATVPLAGGTPRLLGTAYSYVASPLGDLVAFAGYGASSDGLRVADLEREQEICRFTGDGATGLTFLPDGRGLVFSAYTSTGSGKLVYLSLSGCAPTELAKLDIDRVDGAIPPKTGSGFVDPTSCFAIVQSNAPNNAGTSLVLLPP